MMDQYYGTKELYEVVLRAKTPMQFGERYIEAGEPVLYFENVSMSLLSEQSYPIFARGGWANMPRVIWEDRSEIQFQLSEGVMSNVGMSILLSANVSHSSNQESALLIPKREAFESGLPTLSVNINGQDVEVPYVQLEHWPVDYPTKKTFIFCYERDTVQKKIYGKKRFNMPDPFTGDIIDEGVPTLLLFEDKNCTIPADYRKQYLVDYYFEYGEEALIYTVQKERFNGLFTLEGKFYSKDENDCLNYTNVIYMPKVRVVSNIDLRLGERANPTVSVFNIIGMPENTGGAKKSLILEITRLNSDIDAEI